MRKVFFKCSILVLLVVCIVPPVFSNEYQDIYNQAWQLINNNFYDSTMNHQQWSYWQKRYNIQTQDDLIVAIETMLASLNDPYTRYLQKINFSKETNAIYEDCTDSISNTPNGSSINHKGITPGIEVWFTFKDIFFYNVIQLKEAIKYLQSSMAH